MSTYGWRTKEVLVVISPQSGEEPTTVRVVMRQGQLRDAFEKARYGDHLFDAIGETICPALDLDAAKCRIGVIEESAKERGLPKNEYLRSFDFTKGGLEGMLYLH